ncbi:hypothetical protein BDW74DRAFT_156190 [Aspergillus multicolor]|uniref:uncharacterized protein n=1 Tax=Aspergillus multicolor TaxID=41759 RepID=UPI003CCE1D6E
MDQLLLAQQEQALLLPVDVGPGDPLQLSRKRAAPQDDGAVDLKDPSDAKRLCTTHEQPDVEFPNDLHQEHDTDAVWIRGELDKITSSRQPSSNFLDMDESTDFSDSDDAASETESIFSHATESTEAVENDVPFPEGYFLYLESFARIAPPYGPGIPENFDFDVFLMGWNG